MMDWTQEETREIHERIFAKDLRNAWSDICDVLPEAPAVELPNFGRPPLEHDVHSFSRIQHPVGVLFDRFLRQFKGAEELLAEGLDHPNPMVVAYSLVGLARLDSALLDSLVQKLHDRREMLFWSSGNCAGQASLGDIAKLFPLRKPVRW